MLWKYVRLLFAVGITGALFLFAACQTDDPTAAVSGLKAADPGIDVLDAVQRPIEEFVDAQGTYCWPDGEGGCLLFVPPVENFFGWSDPAKGICSAFDYAGLADEWITAASGGSISFGTTTSGSVTETLLSDGSVEVHVRLHTKNAMTFAVNACNNYNTDPLLFGNRAAEIFAGGEAALGNGFFHIKYIAPEPGAPMPDLIQLAFTNELPGYALKMVSIDYRAEGTLRETSGYPEGTPARLHCIENGLFFTGFNGAVGDGFPVERIDIQLTEGGRGQITP